MTATQQRSLLTSIAIIVAALGLTYAPLPGAQQTIVVVAGSELEEPLNELEQRFASTHPGIKLELKIQGSQDMVNNYLDDKNDLVPTVLIPANGEKLMELRQRSQAQNQSDPFYDAPQPIAKTLLVGVAWPERGKVLFPTGQFDWTAIERAIQTPTWAAIGGQANWGSFDFVITDPARSNSGQLALSLLLQNHLRGTALTRQTLSDPTLQPLVNRVKKSVYQPPRSTDILLQEFISRGANDADVAIVYESIALYRWQQSSQSQATPYQIYYLNPTIETVAMGAIVRRKVTNAQADAARQFLRFLTQPEQQSVFVRYGFRPIDPNLNVSAVANSPWQKGVPGTLTTPPGQVVAAPSDDILSEVIRLWERAN